MSTIDDFKEDIISSFTEGSTHPQLLEWLQTRNVSISESTLRRRLEQWGCRRKAHGPASSDLISRIDDLYHRTLWPDTRIAKELSEELELTVTRNQVQEIRLKKGWLRQLETKQQVHDLFHTGSGRSYGRSCSVASSTYSMAGDPIYYT